MVRQSADVLWAQLSSGLEPLVLEPLVLEPLILEPLVLEPLVLDQTFAQLPSVSEVGMQVNCGDCAFTWV